MSEIRKGFLLGIGLIIPLLAVQFITVKYSFLEVANDSEGSNASYESYNTSYIEQISLSPTIEKKQGVQLLISGQFTNNSEK
jgi:hypothetical protein